MPSCNINRTLFLFLGIIKHQLLFFFSFSIESTTAVTVIITANPITTDGNSGIIGVVGGIEDRVGKGVSLGRVVYAGVELGGEVGTAVGIGV